MKIYPTYIPTVDSPLRQSIGEVQAATLLLNDPYRGHLRLAASPPPPPRRSGDGSATLRSTTQNNTFLLRKNVYIREETNVNCQMGRLESNPARNDEFTYVSAKTWIHKCVSTSNLCRCHYCKIRGLRKGNYEKAIID